MHRHYWPSWDLELIGSGRAFEESSFVLPRQRLALDAGWGRLDVFAQPTMLLSHLHMDHALGLPRYAVNRHKMGDGRCRIIVPADALAAAQDIVGASQRAEGRRDDIEWIGARAGDEVRLDGPWRLKIFDADHGIPTIGGILQRHISRLKPEFADLPSDEVGRRVRAGEPVLDERWVPVFAYAGDTEVTVLDRVPELYEAAVLLMECTFVEALHEQPIKVPGHTHWAELCARAERFGGEALVLTHFSRRYAPETLWRHLDRTCPPSLRERLVPLIPVRGTDDRSD